MISDTLFTGVRLLDPASGLTSTVTCWVRDGRIADFGPSLGRPDGAVVVVEDGAILCPGLVDMRAALGEPGYETRETIARLPRPPRQAELPPLAALPTHCRRSTTRHWCVCTRPRRGDRQPDHPALWRCHRGCRGEELAGLDCCAKPERSRYGWHPHRWFGPHDATGAVLCPRLCARIVQQSEDPSLAAGGAATEGELATRLACPDPGRRRSHIGRGDIRLAALTGGGAFCPCFDSRDIGADPSREGRWRRRHLRYRAAVFRPERDARSVISAPMRNCRRHCARKPIDGWRLRLPMARSTRSPPTISRAMPTTSASLRTGNSGWRRPYDTTGITLAQVHKGRASARAGNSNC